MTAPPAERRFDLRRFLASGEGWPYVLVPFIPLAIALDLIGAGAAIIFFSSALGVIPTAALMGRATEELASNRFVVGVGIGKGRALNALGRHGHRHSFPARHLDQGRVELPR